MITGAIFDLDGTLLDSMGIWDDLGIRLLEKLGLTPKEDITTVLKTLNVVQFSHYVKDNYDTDKTPEELSKMMYSAVEDFYYYTVTEKAGVKEFLQKLKENGVKMILATASESYFVKRAMDRCGLTPYFEAIITCSQVGYGKDKPYIYREALKIIGTEKQKTVVFEDVLHALTTAKNDGFYTVGIDDEFAINKDKIPEMCDVFMEDYRRDEEFWKFASEL